MKIGSTPITDIKVGSTPITKVIRNGIIYWEVDSSWTPQINFAIEGHSFLSGGSNNANITTSRINYISYFNGAVGGTTIADMIGRQAALDANLVVQTLGKKNVLLIWNGVNDVNDTVGTGTTAYNAIKSYVQNRVNAGWKVLLYTMVPNISDGKGAQFEIERNAFNTLLKNDLSIISNVYILDTDTIAELDSPDDASNLLYYTANGHLTTMGYWLASDLFVNQMILLYGTDVVPAEDPLTNFTVTSTGSGVGVSTLTLQVTRAMKVTLDGNGLFYTDAAGTLNPSTSWVCSPVIQNTIYIKCSGGVSNLLFYGNNILTVSGWVSGTNASSLGGNIAALTSLNYLNVSGSNTLSGSISALTSLTYLQVYASNTLSGSIAALTSLTYLYVQGTNTLTGSVAGLTSLTYLGVGGSNTLTGSVAGLTLLTYLQVGGSNTLSGSIAALTLLTYLQVFGSNTLTGSIAALTLLTYLYVAGSNTLSFPNVTNITGLCYLRVWDNILTSANVNQLLADFWLNKDAAKTITERVINISGNPASGAPTGQGITDKAALAAYRSPTPPGTAALWTVTTR